MLGNTLEEQQHGYLTIRVCKDKNGWANDLFRRGRLTMRITRVSEGYRLRGIELEAQTLTLLYKLADYGVRAKLLLSFWVKSLEKPVGFLITEKYDLFLFQAWKEDADAVACAFKTKEGKYYYVEHIGVNYPSWLITEETVPRLKKAMRDRRPLTQEEIDRMVAGHYRQHAIDAQHRLVQVGAWQTPEYREEEEDDIGGDDDYPEDPDY